MELRALTLTLTLIPTLPLTLTKARVFLDAPRGVTKIVLATNVAEASVTITPNPNPSLTLP